MSHKGQYPRRVMRLSVCITCKNKCRTNKRQEQFRGWSMAKEEVPHPMLRLSCTSDAPGKRRIEMKKVDDKMERSMAVY